MGRQDKGKEEKVILFNFNEIFRGFELPFLLLVTAKSNLIIRAEKKNIKKLHINPC